MAKDDLDLDDFDLDDELNFDLDFEPPASKIPDAREALAKAPIDAAKGAANAIVGEGKRKDLILKSLPSEYRIASDSYDTISSEGKDLFKHAKEEYKNTRTEFKRTVRELTPTVNRYLPKGARKWLEKLGEDNSQYSGYDDENGDPRDLAINALLADTFNGQRDVEQAQREIENRAETEVREAIKSAKSDQTNKVVSDIRLDIAKLVGHSHLSDKYRKKMLEVNYRQWYALTDIHEQLKLSMEHMLPAIDSIVKNTSLPDYAKEILPEVAEARIKRMVIGALSPGQFVSDFLPKMSANAKAAITDFSSQLRDGLQMAGMAGGMGDDGFSDMESGPLSESQETGRNITQASETLGGLVAKKFINPHIRKGQNKLREMGENNSVVSDFGKKLAYNASTIPEYINDMVRSPQQDSILSALFSAIAPTYDGEEGKLTEISAERLAEAVPFDNRTHTTVNEIIPGLLTRIDQGVRLLKDENAAEVTYDWKTRSFIDRKELGRRIRNNIKDKDEDEFLRERIEEMVKAVDVDSDLDDESKKALRQVLDKKIRTVGRFNIDRLSEEYEEYDGVDADPFDLQNHFSLLKANGKAADMNYKISRMISDTRGLVSAKQDRINEIAGIQGEKALVDSGIFLRDKDTLTYNSEMLGSSEYDENWVNGSTTLPKKKKTPASVSETPPTNPTPPGGAPGIARMLKDALGSYATRSSAGPSSYSDDVRNGVRDALFGEREPNLVSELAKLHQQKPEQAEGSIAEISREIHKQLVENNLKAEMGVVVDMLERLLSEGIAINENGTAYGDGLKVRMKSMGSFAFKAGKDAATKAWQFGKGGAGKIKDGLSWAKRKLPSHEGVREGIVGTLRQFKNGVMNTADIRDADGNVVLFGRKLKLGEYFDSNGKVIKSIKDIQGAVYDRMGNIVLTEEEVRQKADEFTLYAKNGWKKLSEFVGRTGGRMLGVGLDIPAMVLKKLNAGRKFISRKLSAVDVYIEGEESPRLTKRLMEQGYYIDMDTRNPIFSVNDITGPVITKHNEKIITPEDLAKPGFKLVDANGEEFKSVGKKIIAKIGKIKDFAIKTAKRIAESARKLGGMALDGLGAGKDWIKSKFGSDSRMSDEGTDRVISRLDMIYDLLDDRLRTTEEFDASMAQQAPDEVKGDVDGDGDRDGGFRDLFQRRQDARDKARAERDAKISDKHKKTKEKSSNGLLSLLGGAMSKLKGLGGIIGTAIAGTFTTLVGSKLAGFFGGKAATAAAGSVAGSVASSAAGAATASSAAAAAAGVAGGAKKPGLLSRAGKMMGKAAGFVGRQVLWGGVRAVGAAALGVVSAPVALGALAVGAAAYGIYKFATSVDNDPLMRLRVAQYGTKENEDGKSEQVAQLRGLEVEFLKYTTYSGEGLSTIKGVKGEVVDQMASIFGIEKEDEERLINFQEWLRTRFIPIFLLWTTRARQQAPNVDFQDIGNSMKLHPNIQVKILDGVKLPVDHPALSIQASPFSKGFGGTITGWFGANPLTTGDEVKEVEEEVVRELLKIQERAKNDKVTTARPDSSKTLSDQSASAAEPTAPNKNAWYNRDSSELKKNEDGTVEIGGKKFKDMQTYRKLRTMNKRKENMSLSSASQNATANTVNIRSTSDLNALDALRLKAYGLSELKVDKVEVLFDLETHINGLTSSDGKTAKADLRAEETADMFMARFGLTVSNGSHRQRFIEWYAGRFAAVWLKYVTELKKRAGNANPLNVIVSSSTPYMYNVGMAIVGAMTFLRGKEVSIWEFDISPWGVDVPLAMSPKVVEGNLAFLKDISKHITAREQELAEKQKMSKSVDKLAGKRKEDSLAKEVTTSERPSGTSMNDAINALYKGGASAGTNRVTSEQGTAASYGNIPVGEMTDGDADSGHYGKLRVSDHSPSSIAELIKKAAKAAGIDSNLLLTVGMMESALNPMASAGTSSAKGLFQFINSTWKDQLGKHGNKYGIPSTASPLDPVANALLGAEYIKAGAKTVGSALPRGQKAGPADLYLAHFLGPGGARKFLQKMQQDPNRIAAKDFTAGAKANAGIFTNKGIPRTYTEVYREIQNRAFKNFRHIAKYSDNPGAPVPNISDKAIDSPISSDDKVAINKHKVAQESKKVVNAEKAMMAAPASIPSKPTGPSPTETAVKRVTETATADVELGNKVSSKEHLAKLRQETMAVRQNENAEIKRVDDANLKKAADAGVASANSLDTLVALNKDMVQYLRQFIERDEAAKGTAAEQQQVARKHAQENRSAPSVVHATAPISTRRKFYD